MYECFASMYGCAPHACLMPIEARSRTGSLEIGVTNTVNHCLDARDLNPELLGLQQMLLTTELSLQPFPFLSVHVCVHICVCMCCCVYICVAKCMFVCECLCVCACV